MYGGHSLHQLPARLAKVGHIRLRFTELGRLPDRDGVPDQSTDRKPAGWITVKLEFELLLLATWGKLTSVRFLGRTSRGFDSDIPLSEDRPTTGSRLGDRATVRCEIFEVKQVGGMSYGLPWWEMTGG
jgi:hypothetical protein